VMRATGPACCATGPACCATRPQGQLVAGTSFGRCWDGVGRRSVHCGSIWIGAVIWIDVVAKRFVQAETGVAALTRVLYSWKRFRDGVLVVQQLPLGGGMSSGWLVWLCPRFGVLGDGVHVWHGDVVLCFSLSLAVLCLCSNFARFCCRGAV